MEGSPPGFDIDGLIQAIKDLAGEGDEIEIHDFHLWEISQGKMALSAHAAPRPKARKANSFAAATGPASVA